jgi:hypothetical protein
MKMAAGEPASAFEAIAMKRASEAVSLLKDEQKQTYVTRGSTRSEPPPNLCRNFSTMAGFNV